MCSLPTTQETDAAQYLDTLQDMFSTQPTLDTAHDLSTTEDFHFSTRALDTHDGLDTSQDLYLTTTDLKDVKDSRNLRESPVWGNCCDESSRSTIFGNLSMTNPVAVSRATDKRTNHVWDRNSLASREHCPWKSFGQCRGWLPLPASIIVVIWDLNLHLRCASDTLAQLRSSCGLLDEMNRKSLLD